MYVLSASNKRVNVELVGKSKIEDILGKFEELPGASLSYLGVSSPGDPVQISKTLPSKFQLILTIFILGFVLLKVAEWWGYM